MVPGCGTPGSMNAKQRDSAARFLYDVSKGLLLASIIAPLTDKAAWISAVALAGLAFYAFVAAHILEGGENGSDKCF
ncbi:MAG: hypothetical protein HQL74_07365 [Magnetococcales bacterium]|nr:hypothetical protein [Magnetococcales bacterium]